MTGQLMFGVSRRVETPAEQKFFAELFFKKATAF